MYTGEEWTGNGVSRTLAPRVEKLYVFVGVVVVVIVMRQNHETFVQNNDAVEQARHNCQEWNRYTETETSRYTEESTAVHICVEQWRGMDSTLAPE